jgi:hypothetical protein
MKVSQFTSVAMDTQQKLSEWWFLKFLKGIIIVFVIVVIGGFSLMASAEILPSPLKEWGAGLKEAIFFNTGGPLSGTWITDADELCIYTYIKDNISIAKIEGSCTLEIFDSKNGIHANLDFTYKSMTFITQDASLKKAVTSLKPEEFNTRFKLNEGNYNNSVFTFKTYLRSGTIHEFAFTMVDTQNMKATKANTIPGVESVQTKFVTESLVFVKKAPGFFE